jgi:hypothetical protein
MNDARSSRHASRKPDLSYGPMVFSNFPSSSADERLAASELRARIEVWMNEGGAGGDANQ